MTLCRFRGRSGSRPRARVRWNAWSCPATIDTIGPSHSGVPVGKLDRPARQCQRGGQVRDDHQRRIEIRPQPREQRDEVGLGRPGPGDREDRHAGLDQRQRAVLEVGRGIRVGEDAGELLELERPFARGGVLVAAGDDERPRRGGLVGGDPLDLGLELEGSARWRLGDRRDGGLDRPGRSDSAADSDAIASSSAVYVLVAAIARSGPATEGDRSGPRPPRAPNPARW